MHRPDPRAAVLLRLLAATLVAALSACTFETKDDSADTGVDAGAVDDDTSKAFDLPTKPEPWLKCEPTSGNVPLNVCCAAKLGIDKKTEGSAYFIELEWFDGTDKTNVDPKAIAKICHEYTYKGIFTPKLTVKWKKNTKVSGEAEQKIEAIQPSALSVSDVKLHSQELIATGDTIKVSFLVTNEGQEVEHAFKTGVFLSVDDKVDAKDFLIHEIKHDKIASGLTEPVVLKKWSADNPLSFKLGKTVDGKDVADGNYFLIVKVDHEDKVGELNKINNAFYAGSLIEVDNAVYLKSDLTISSPDVDTSATFTPGDQASFKLKVSNKGPGEAKHFKMAVYLSKDKIINHDPKLEPSKVDITKTDLLITDKATATFTTLKPGSSLPIQRTFPVPEIPDGKYWLIAKIDVEDALAEVKEDNNVALSTGQLEVKKVIQQGVNLNLLSMDVKPKGTYLEGSVSIAYHVKNDGTKQTPEFDATVYFCKGALSKKGAACAINKTSFKIKPLAVGQEFKGLQIVNINKSTPIQSDGYNVYLLIDPDSKVDELDEGDNIKKFPGKGGPKLKITSVKSVDLICKSVGFHPGKLTGGGDLKIGYKTINGGTSGTGAFTTYVVASKDNKISTASVKSGEDFVISKVIDPGIGSLGVEYRVNKVVLPKGLDHKINGWYVGLYLDAENSITGEDSETNNTCIAAKKLDVSGTEGGCYEDKYDKDAKTNNNTKKTAAALKTGLTKGLACCGDEDWFTVDVNKGYSMFVTMQANAIQWTSPVPSDLDIDIVAPSGKVLSSVKGLGNFKKATALTVAEGGKYLLRIYPHTSSVKGHYELDVKVEPPPSGIDLFAASLTAGPTVTFPGALLKTKLKMTNLGNNPAPKFDVHYLLSTDPKPDAKDLKIVKHTFTKGLGGAAGLTLNKNLLLPDTVKGGKYYLIAQLDSGAVINEKDEKNNVATSNSIVLSGKIKCASDSFSGNHTVEDAAVLAPKTQELKKLNVCPGLEDWFVMDMPQGKALTIELIWKHEPPKGIVGVQVVDSTGKGVIAGAANPFNSVAKIPYLQVGGKYYLHTYVLPEFGGQPEPRDYGIKVTVAEPDPSDVCKPDVYESNNSFGAAKEVGCGLANLTLCLGDEDWFFLDMQKDEEIKFIFTQKGGSFVFNIYDNPKLKPIKSLTSSGEIAFKAPKVGKYYMQAVYAQGAGKPSNFEYKLKVDGGKGIDIIPEIKSVYPTKATGDETVAIDSKVSNECKTAAPAFHLGYYFSYDAKLDKSDLLLHERPIGGLAGKTAKNYTDKVIIPIGAKVGKANIIVKVDSRNAIKESQELNNIDIEELNVVESCAPDAKEPNNSPSYATKFDGRRLDNLTLCPNERDWFEISAKKGETVTLTMEFKHTDGDLDMRLYAKGKYSKPLWQSATKASPEQISFTAPADGSYMLRIAGFQGSWNSYRLLQCKAVGSKCVECTNKSQCGGDDICKDTKCQPLGCTIGVAKTCDDGNSCTLGMCVKDKGCSYTTLTGIECEDGDLCTMGHTCDAKGSCAAAPSQAVTSTVWNDNGTGGDLAWIPSTGERLLVGSRMPKDGTALVAHASMVGPTGIPLWNRDYIAKGAAACHLSSAMTQTGMDEVVTVGWCQMAAATTITNADQAKDTGVWLGRIAGGTGMANGWSMVHDGKSTKSGVMRMTGIEGKLYATVGWASADAIKDGVDAYAAVFDGTLKVAAQVKWGGVGNDAFHDVVQTSGGGFVAAGVNRDSSGKGVGVLVAWDGKYKKLWEAPLPLAKFQTTLWTVTRDKDGGIVAGGGADVGQAGGTPPDYKGWVVWMAPSKATFTPIMAAQLVLEPIKPKAAGYKGVNSALVRKLMVRPDNGVLAVGRTGASSAKSVHQDGAVWSIGADGKLAKAWGLNSKGGESFNSVVWRQGQWRAFGTTRAANANHWYEVRETPLKADCNDGNLCTVDACTAKSGCTHTSVKDGNSCGTGAVCKAGQCVAK